MTTKKNLSSLAKSKATIKKAEPTTKAKPEIEDKKLIAKQKVDELLKDIPLNLEKEEIKENKSETKQKESGIQWLEEQVEKLTQKNEELTKQIELLNNAPAQTSSSTDANVLQLFDELQNGFLRFGGNFIIYFPAFLNRMILFFPFLERYKKY